MAELRPNLSRFFKAAYEDMYAGTKMIRERRKMRRI